MVSKIYITLKNNKNNHNNNDYVWKIQLEDYWKSIKLHFLKMYSERQKFS